MLLAVGMLGGCMSSPQMSRIDRNRGVYETWPLEVKQAVLDGKVETGMNVDMVRVSWGEPSQVATSPAGDEIWVYQRGGDPGSVYYPGAMGGASYPGGGYPGGVYPGGVINSGPGIGISTGRGGTSVGATGGIGIGGGMGGVGIGGSGMGGMGGMGTTPIMTAPTPPEIREVVFRNGVVLRADPPFNTK
jgi:hypothetical protein